MIYLDNAATTKPCEAAVKAMLASAEEFGNPSSMHGVGLRAEKQLISARKTIAQKLGGDFKGVYFTSGGTEANNLAVIGTARAKRRQGKRVIVSKTEHPSVLAAAGQLEEEDFDVIYADVGADGRVDTGRLRSYITEDTILVSVMHVNNETGVIQPVEEISAMVRAAAPKAVVHCDCVQSFCKLPINAEKLGADMITISAHKIHAFKGCGALYTANKHIKPLIYGGEQQGEIRPGTENVGGIMAFAAAADAAVTDMAQMRRKREYMIRLLQEKVPDIAVNGSNEYNSGSVLNVSVMGIKSEILLHALERHEVYISSGSACSSHKPQPSHVLTAMGIGAAAVTGAVRISFCADTTDDEIDRAAQAIAAEAANIRKYMR